MTFAFVERTVMPKSDDVETRTQCTAEAQDQIRVTWPRLRVARYVQARDRKEDWHDGSSAGAGTNDIEANLLALLCSFFVVLVPGMESSSRRVDASGSGRLDGESSASFKVAK